MAGVLTERNQKLERVPQKGVRSITHESCLVTTIPSQFNFAVQHVQRTCVFNPVTDNPAFTTIADIRKVTYARSVDDIIEGVEYKKFKGVYMGLKKYGQKEEQLLFPVVDNACEAPVFLYARMFDGPERPEDLPVMKNRVDSNGHNVALTSCSEYHEINLNYMST